MMKDKNSKEREILNGHFGAIPKEFQEAFNALYKSADMLAGAVDKLSQSAIKLQVAKLKFSASLKK